MRKIFKRIHLWLALPGGIFITLICLTGAIMVFQTEIEETIHHDRYFFSNPQKAENLNLDTLVRIVNTQLVNDTISAIKLFGDPQRNLVATLTSGARVYAYINPTNGKIVDINNARSGFFHKIMTLHRWLMLPNRTLGKVIIGISTIFMIFILISGLIRWCPRRKGRIGEAFKVKFSGKNSFRRVLDFHKVVGVYLSVILLVMCLTGLMWSFNWYRSSVATILNFESSSQKSGKPLAKRSTASYSEYWQQAFDQTRNLNSDYNFINISKTGSISLLPSSALHARATDSYKYDFKTKTVAFSSHYGDKKTTSYMMSQNYAIHVGSWGGVTTKILWFLASLFGTFLPVTGYILFFKRQ